VRRNGFAALGLLALSLVLALPAEAQRPSNRDVTYEPAPAAAKPKLYLLSVGVGAYQNPTFNLVLPAKDAQDVAAAWKAQEGRLYSEVEARVLTDREATRNAILSGLEWMETQATQEDVAVLFFSGHGINDPRTGEYLFLPYEADLAARRTTLVPDRDVRSALASIPGKVLVFLDTCYAGNLLGGARTRGPADLAPLLAELAEAGSGIVVFAAAGGQQQAQEMDGWDNGAFTRALLEALSGKGDADHDGSVRISEIEGYLGRRVRDLTSGLQTPVSRKPGGVPDFPVAVLPGAQAVMPDWPRQPPETTRPPQPAPPVAPMKTTKAAGFLFELVECRANGGGEVVCDLFITSQEDQDLHLTARSTRLVDEAGNQGKLQRIRIGNSEREDYLRVAMVGGVRTSASLTFEGLSAVTSRISLLELVMGNQHAKLRDFPLR
jgi:hypothetical protein